MGRLTPDDDARERHLKAAKEGRYQDAFAAFTTLALSNLLKALDEHGYSFMLAEKPAPTLQFYLALADSLKGQKEKEGEDYDLFLDWAHDFLTTLAGLFVLMTRKDRPGPLSPDDISQIILQAIALGRLVERIELTLEGHFNEFLRLMFNEHEAKAKRREGAHKTNAQKAEVRDSAIERAKSFCDTNPTLTNEELAVKVRESLRLSATIGTISGWFGQARRQGKLPLRINPDR